MKIKAVIGANYGDEGKGLMTNYFSSLSNCLKEKTIVVCNNGGSQRGHTVVTPESIRHVFHHFGSGTFNGADTYLPKDFIINPMNFIKELEELNSIGINPAVYVHPDCTWSTPYDMLINQVIEDLRGDNKHGSCGIGIWETIVRTSYCTPYNFRKFSKVKDLYSIDPKTIYSYLVDIKNNYINFRLKNCNVPDNWKQIISSDGLLEHFIYDLYRTLNYIKIKDTKFLNNYDTVIFENGQGLMLDKKYGKEIDHTTPSNTGVKNVEKNIIRGNLTPEQVEICYVTRTYETRHGEGNFDTECSLNEINSDIFDKTNIHNDFQGSLRFGKLNYDSLINRIQTDFNSSCDKNWKCSVSFTHTNESPILFLDKLKDNFDFIYESDNEISSKNVFEKS